MGVYVCIGWFRPFPSLLTWHFTGGNKAFPLIFIDKVAVNTGKTMAANAEGEKSRTVLFGGKC